MKDFSHELDNALALATDLFGSVMERLLGEKYGPRWFEEELRPRMLRGEGERTGGRYSGFVREHGENFTPDTMDITICASVLLYDEKYAGLTQAFGDNGVDALNALRKARNDAAHAAELSPRDRLALTAVLFGHTALAASAFSLADFNRALDGRIADLACRFGGEGPGASARRADPFEGQMTRAAELAAQSRLSEAIGLCTELAGQKYAPAMLFLARLYRDGTVTPDYPRALGWLRRAEKAGCVEAGPLRKALREFIRQLEKARAGDAGALFSVGRAFETGELVEKNQQKAYQYYGRAIEAGSALAQSYIDARFAEKDLDAVHLKAQLGDAEARKQLEQAAERGRKGRGGGSRR